jgi:DNA-binding protein Fis
MITREAKLKLPVAFDEIEYEVLRDHAEAMIDDLMSQLKGTSPNEIEQLELGIAVWQGILDKLVDN